MVGPWGGGGGWWAPGEGEGDRAPGEGGGGDRALLSRSPRPLRGQGRSCVIVGDWGHGGQLTPIHGLISFH